MRVKPLSATLVSAFVLLLLLLLLCSPGGGPSRGSGGSCRPPPLPPGVTVLLRDFEEGDNDLEATAASFASSFPVLVVAEVAPYPPVPLPGGVTFLPLRPPDPRHPPTPPLGHLLRTRHVAFVPDGARHLPGALEELRDLLESHRGATKVVAAPALGTSGPRPWCRELRVELREWTLRYDPPGGRGVCGWPEGPHVLLLRTRDLLALPFPLARPVGTSVAIQGWLRGWGLRVAPLTFPLAPAPPRTPHALWKLRTAAERRHRLLMEEFGVKREVFGDGRERWHGACGKETPRCFGTIQNRTPSYLHAGRWTPPCCLRALRETARYVVGVLESTGVRYWLEGGTLLGAVRSGDIIPWDYDVDLGLYREDLGKCRWLASVATTGEGLEDPQGYFWEKAPEGEFFRVHYSRTNRLHVDLWPFYPRGDTMTKVTWLGHPQDVEFPERFLLPRIPLPFAGFTAMAPNNPRTFLELKFGPGAIEEPEYPNPRVRSLRGDPGDTWGQ